MALDNPNPKRQPLGVWIMLLALVIAAFLGAAIGLVWQGSDWFSDTPETEVLTGEDTPA